MYGQRVKKMDKLELWLAFTYIELYKEVLSAKPRSEWGSKECKALTRLRKARKEVNDHVSVIEKPYEWSDDPRFDRFYTDGEYTGWTELYVLNVNSEEEVREFMKDYYLNEEYIHPYASAYDCTGQLFGGAPSIRPLCEGRYILSYRWYRDY